MDFKRSSRVTPCHSSKESYFSSALTPFKIYLTVHGFYDRNYTNDFAKTLLWLYRILFLFCPLYTLIRSAFGFSSVTFGFNLGFILLLAAVAWSFQAVVGSIYMMYIYKNHKIEQLEALWKEYRFDFAVRKKCPKSIAIIPVLYPVLYTVINCIIFALQAADVIPGKTLELGINFKGPYLNPIFTIFSGFAWGSCQALFTLNVNRYRFEPRKIQAFLFYAIFFAALSFHDK